MSGRWLATPNESLLARLDPKFLVPLPPAATMQQVERVSIGDNGEQLVELPSTLASIEGGYHELPISTVPPKIMLRESVVERLEQAQQLLPRGFTLCILDGWRSPQFQADLLAYYQGHAKQDDLEGFVSDPEHSHVVAPHTTGGAFDLTLAWDNKPLGLGTDWDAFTADAAYLAFEPDHADTAKEPRSQLSREGVKAERLASAWGSRELVQGLRRTLSHALLEVGCAPLATEWWHWSYGEQQWAAFTGLSESLYGEVQAEP